MNLDGHIVICGWGEKAFRVVRQLHAPVVRDKKPILLMADEIGDLPEEPAFDNVFALGGDPTREDALHAAAVEHADAAIILSDETRGASADARSILIAIAIESINPQVHTSVEVIDEANLAHFSRTAVNETVSLSELSEKLLAQAALNHGATEFYQELLLSQEEGNEFYRVKAPLALVGQTFANVSAMLRPKQIIPIGVHREERVQINPAPGYVLQGGDDLWVIALQEPTQDDL